MKYFVILDGGHGNDTPGKRTPDGILLENDFNATVVNKIYANIQKYSTLDCFITAPEKYDVPVTTRVARAEQAYTQYKKKYPGAIGILISIHANAFGTTWNNACGVETYCYPNSPNDRKLAETIQAELIKGTTQTNRGVKEEKFIILSVKDIWACLCECAFMTNKTEAKMLETETFRQEVATEVTKGILNYCNISSSEIKEEEPLAKTTEVTVTQNKSYYLCNAVDKLGVKFVDKNNRTIEEETCVNGTFFWHDSTGTTYPTSILIVDGKVHQAYANHYLDFGCPQSVFIVYKNNKVEMKRVKTTKELDISNIRLAIGGVGLVNKLDKSFTYNPAVEGFKGKYADVLRKTNKTTLGYNLKENKVYLLVRPNIFTSNAYQFDLLQLCDLFAFDIAVGLDGGGSTFFNDYKAMLIKGDGRRINNIIGFNL